jgi:predicted Fe-S protein YdhL (DUF1289 family)
MTPCIGICKLVDDVCVGCHRTIEEIKRAYNEPKSTTKIVS